MIETVSMCQAASQKRDAQGMNYPALVDRPFRRQQDQQCERGVLDEVAVYPNGTSQIMMASIPDGHAMPPAQQYHARGQNDQG